MINTNENNSRPSKTYHVEETDHGIYLTDQEKGHRFFQTRAGGWFWLIGKGNPFGEDVALHKDRAQYLSSIVETSKSASGN